MPFSFFSPQESIGEWLMQLGLSQYDYVMLDSGYDDIDFVVSVTEEDLMDIGITKKGKPPGTNMCSAY